MNMKPTGIQFPHGVPRGLKQFSVVQPGAPPTPKPKAQPAPAAGHGARPKKGGGSTAAPSTSRYVYYQSEPKSESEPSSSKNSDLDIEACTLCYRSRTTVYCWQCGFERSNLRVSKACPRHVNVRFLYDMVECPACLTKSLAEEDHKMTE